MNSYLDEFLSLRCAPDVLEAVHPLRRPEKEISESMALVTAIRGRLLASRPVTGTVSVNTPGMTLLDLCAGNALTGVIVAHLFRGTQVVAVDKREHIRDGFVNVRNFSYWQRDINALEEWAEWPAMSTVVVASHACGKLSEAIIDLCMKRGAPMAIIPCCLRRSRLPDWTDGIAKEKGKYFAWLTYLAQRCGGRFRIDGKCLSPCNGVVTRGL